MEHEEKGTSHHSYSTSRGVAQHTAQEHWVPANLSGKKITDILDHCVGEMLITAKLELHKALKGAATEGNGFTLK